MSSTPLASVIAAASPSLFAALFVLAMGAAIVGGGVWLVRNDRRR
ncbi:MAG: hypothetical protein AAFZ07_18490 [Actinomycetota bacterium]